jgi:PAS domain S-box-containing protein
MQFVWEVSDPVYFYLNMNARTHSDTNPGFLSAGGQLGQLIRSIAWADTPLGPVERWPQSLRSALSICLNSNFPIAIYWGKDLHLLYNDAWSSIPGNKHPWALGKPARQVWPDIWSEIEPQFGMAFSGQPGGSKDALLPMQRHGYTEECYFDFTFTPIYGETGTVDGVFNAVIETTYRVLNERRTGLLKQMALQLAGATTTTEVYQQAIRFITGFSKDIPFAFLYLVDSTNQPQLVASTHPHPTGYLKKDWPFKLVHESGRSLLIADIAGYLTVVPNGFWPEVPHNALLVPLKTNAGTVNGFLCCGLSARLGYDEDYATFIEGAANIIITSVGHMASLEEERKRAETLAELDRAKTTFFTNISHEFRTPLTLLLGPLEEMRLASSPEMAHWVPLEVAYRNAMRMQKLVNTLLEFSKLEAGRAKAAYQPIDIGAFTAELASNFRSAIEQAGMQLRLRCEPIQDRVYLDPDMWEKIVLNLVSNAVKYSDEGIITVGVRQVDALVEVAVSDTGIGIADDQLDKLFNRFYRISNSRGRSQEGTGIGLALVNELVKLHAGTIYVASQPGKGSVFTVRIPVGKSHLPPDQVIEQPTGPSPGQAIAYVQEALQWSTANTSSAAGSTTKADDTDPTRLPSAVEKRYTILLADDNADMRAYVQRLLADQFRVLTAVDGQDAFTQILRHRPDLILSDVMMPELDGFGLLKKVRNHPDLKAIPVIFLSARAGEEASVEGLDAGADDYLVKPFSAKELIVRVTNHLRLNQIRRETEQQFYQLFMQAPALINVLKGPNHVFEFFHPNNKRIFGEVDLTGLAVRDALPELEKQGIIALLDEVYQTGRTIEQQERQIAFVTQASQPDVHYLNFIYQPWYDIRGQVQGVLNFALDVTEQVLARHQSQESEAKLRSLIEQAPVATALFVGRELVIDVANELMIRFFGKGNTILGKPIRDVLTAPGDQRALALLDEVFATGTAYDATGSPAELTINGIAGTYYFNVSLKPIRNGAGAVYAVLEMAVDVTEQVLARQKLEEAEAGLRGAVELAQLGTWSIDVGTNGLTYSDRLIEWFGYDPGDQDYTEVIPLLEAEDQDRVASAVAWALNPASGGIYDETYTVIHPKTGQKRILHAQGKTVFDATGKAIRMNGTAQDVTQQRAIQLALEQQVDQRTRQLQALVGDLERSNENLRQFAYVASHDLQEPLRKIQSFADLLQSQYAHQLGAGVEHLQRMQVAASRMSTLIRDLLSYSRISTRQEATGSVSLTQVVQEVVTDLDLLIRETSATIDVVPLPVVPGNASQLRQLFQNLLSNALKFRRVHVPPVVRVHCQWLNAAQLPASVRPTRSAPTYYRIDVIDNGIGFDDKYVDRIFQVFQRLHNRSQYPGTGIGLAICQKVAANHGGAITAVSQSDQGSTFSLYLPV